MNGSWAARRIRPGSCRWSRGRLHSKRPLHAVSGESEEAWGRPTTMAIEANCSGCDRTLRVSDEFAGEVASCPVCGATTVMPSAEELEPAIWRLRTPEGQVYGPVRRPEFDSWVQDGRIDLECEVSDDGKVWRRASELFPELAPATQVSETAPAAAPVQVVSSIDIGYLQPHRSSLVMTMGVLAWVTCPLFSVFAWVLGAADVRDMRNGAMDPGGLAQTQAGMVLGMVNVIMWMLAGVISVLVVLFVVAAR